MPRNLDYRVEAITPVEDPTQQRRLEQILQVNLSDDDLAWELGPDGTWTKVPVTKGLNAQVRFHELAAGPGHGPGGVRPPCRRRRSSSAPSPGFRLPDLDDVLEGFVATSMEPQKTATVYLDTEDLRLARWGVSLRHRSGEGWTVKLPAEMEGSAIVRGEHTFAGDAKTPPDAAVDLLRAYVRTAELHPSASLRTIRRRVEIRNDEGRMVVEVVDDEVSIYDGRRLAARFRELEIETREGAPDELVEGILERLREAGSGSPDPTPKYVRAVGPRAFDPPEVAVEDVDAHSTAGEVVRRALSASVVRLLRSDAGVRLGDDPEDVHQARVATRRLRSDLRTFAPVLEVEWSEPLRDELRWLGGLLGDVRDTEVQMDRMRGHMQGLPEEDQLVHLLDGLAERRTKGREALVEALRGERYVALLDRLVEAAAEPALLPEADKPADEILPDLVVKPWRKLRKAVKALGDPPADAELHAVRIRAKRARYAAEAVAPAFGKKAAEFAEAAAGLQDVLGEHQDAVVAQDWLRKAVARAKPGLAFAAGQLAALEIQSMREARQAWPKAWKKVRRRSPDHW